MDNSGERNVQDNHLALPKSDATTHNTIYHKLKLSMKRLNHHQQVVDDDDHTPSPEGVGELRDMLHRLVEIDTESRQILVKVFSLLEKDEGLESYVKKRIEDPKVSKMWQLVEQVLACQEGDVNNIDELLLMKDDDYDDSSDYFGNYDKGLQEMKGYSMFAQSEKNDMDDDTRNERFKVKHIASGNTQGQGASSSTTNNGVK